MSTLTVELYEAVSENRVARVREIAARNPELLDELDSTGTMLHAAASHGALDVAKVLVQLGANINCEAKLGGTPLQCAAAKGHVDLVKYFLELGALLGVSRPDKNPLFAAITKGHVEVVRLLLDAGIDAHAVYRTSRLKNALTHARDQGREEIIAILMAAGCKPPLEGVDQPIWDAKLPAVTAEPSSLQISRAIEAVFGRVDSLAQQDVLALHDQIRIAINVIRPNKKHPYLSLFTTGMSAIPMRVPKGQEEWRFAELIIHLPANWSHPRDVVDDPAALWPSHWLRQIAYLPHLNNTWLGGPHTIISSADPPEPLGPNTKQTCLLLVADAGGFPPLKVGGEKVVHLYTVNTLYTEERDYEVKHGWPKFSELLTKSGVTMAVDIHRKNLFWGNAGSAL